MIVDFEVVALEPGAGTSRVAIALSGAMADYLGIGRIHLVEGPPVVLAAVHDVDGAPLVTGHGDVVLTDVGALGNGPLLDFPRLEEPMVPQQRRLRDQAGREVEERVRRTTDGVEIAWNVPCVGGATRTVQRWRDGSPWWEEARRVGEGWAFVMPGGPDPVELGSGRILR